MSKAACYPKSSPADGRIAITQARCSIAADTNSFTLTRQRENIATVEVDQ